MIRSILCFGDSNTHGTRPIETLDGNGRFGHESRWPSVMGRALGPGYEVIAEGHPGRTTVHDDPTEGPHRNGARVLPAILGSHAPLDLVVLMLGTNDLKRSFALTPHEIGDGIAKLVKIILGAECGPGGAAPQILLVVPPPILEAGCLAEMFEGGAAKSLRLLPEYQAIAAKWGTGLLDAGKVIVSSPLDGVHLAADQHEKLGRAVAEAVVDQMGKA